MKNASVLLLLSLFLSSCIGDDIIFDTVDETVRIIARADSIAVGETYQFEGLYTNNVGMEEAVKIEWESSAPAIVSIDENGLAAGLTEGTAIITASVMTTDDIIKDETSVIIADQTVSGMPDNRTGILRTTSSYTLEGSFELRQIDTGALELVFAEDYTASSNLPGLYVYLTNNPNSISDALEIGAVDVFDGEHSYTLPGDIAINQYSHLLYWCKPFSVKVGDGIFEN